MNTQVFFVGTKNGKKFSTTCSKDAVQQLLTCALNGEDEFLESCVANLDLAGECIDAMSWEAEDFIQKMIIAMDIKGRFGIHHNELIFGVATDEVNAMAAFKNKEF